MIDIFTIIYLGGIIEDNSSEEVKLSVFEWLSNKSDLSYFFLN